MTPAPASHPRNLWSWLPVFGTGDHWFGGWTPNPRSLWSTLPDFGTLDHRFGGWGS